MMRIQRCALELSYCRGSNRNQTRRKESTVAQRSCLASPSEFLPVMQSRSKIRDGEPDRRRETTKAAALPEVSSSRRVAVQAFFGELPVKD